MAVPNPYVAPEETLLNTKGRRGVRFLLQLTSVALVFLLLMHFNFPLGIALIGNFPTWETMNSVWNFWREFNLCLFCCGYLLLFVFFVFSINRGRLGWKSVSVLVTFIVVQLGLLTLNTLVMACI